MSRPTFKKLLLIISPLITKKVTRWRLPVAPEVRLALTLRYLAAGGLIKSLAYSYRLGFSTAGQIIHETCQALWRALVDMYMPVPTTAYWQKAAEGFTLKWHFPNCVAAIDGKHVRIEAPWNSGSEHYNYKHFHSIVLMATCTADYKFSMVEVGSCGRESDAGIFSSSTIGTRLESGQLHLPNDVVLPGGEKLPFVIVADGGFPLKPYMMRPFPGKGLTQIRRIFNYRLSRARRMIENTFGILAAKWRIFRGAICVSPKNVDNIIKAACVLHNFVMMEEKERYCHPSLIDRELPNGHVVPGEWRQEGNTAFEDCSQAMCGNRYSQRADYIRDAFAKYFISGDGEVPWQYNYI